MAKIILEEPHLGGIQGFEERIAKHLYTAGYRKQSEGEWENRYKEKYKYRCSLCCGGSDLCSDYCPNCGARMKGDEGK